MEKQLHSKVKEKRRKTASHLSEDQMRRIIRAKSYEEIEAVKKENSDSEELQRARQLIGEAIRRKRAL